MTEKITCIQKGSSNTQIGEQNNVENINNSIQVSVESKTNFFVGASLDEVTRIVTNLFLDNFPRMQQIAKEEAQKRVNELWDNIVVRLSQKEVNDLSAFMEPDVQFMLYEAQKGYARFATEDLLSTLSSLVAERVKQNNGDLCLKASIDQAISIAHLLSQEQLDYLSLLFVVTRVKFKHIKTITDLEEHLNIINDAFPNVNSSNWIYLQMYGCLQLALPNVCKNYANVYNLNIKDIENICPSNIKNMSGDYSTSPVGTILAIINAETKIPYRFDLKNWIHN